MSTMETTTNLRVLRHRYGLSLTELEAVSRLSNQYISRAELGEIAVTARLENQLESAVEEIIARREAALKSFKTDFQHYRGRLLRPAEDMEHDE